MRSKIFQKILDETPKDVDLFVHWYTDLLVRINQLLREKKINQKELAEKMDKKPSEISKWLNGEHNFTLRSLAKLSVELGEPLLEVPKRSTEPNFINGYTRSVHTFVSYKKRSSNKSPKIIAWYAVNKIKSLNNVG